jgi:hypothetical protein
VILVILTVVNAWLESFSWLAGNLAGLMKLLALNLLGIYACRISSLDLWDGLIIQEAMETHRPSVIPLCFQFFG